jgi:alanyl-tRNA synthetase
MVKPTIRLYENDSYIKGFTATVVSCEEKDGAYLLVLDETAFFPEGGGQDADKGKIGDTDVLDVQIKDEVIYHKISKPFEVGTTVDCTLDWDTRFVRMQNHTGEHIVSGVIHSLFGYNNVGFHMNDSVITLDVDGALTEEDIKTVELKSNKAIYDNKPIKAIYPTAEELPDYDYRSKLNITEGVRLIEIEDYDLCACCAPHVAKTGEIGIIKILSFIPYKKGTRIEMICGLLALNDYRNLHTTNKMIMNMLSAKRFEIADAVERIQNELACLKAENKKLMAEMASLKMEKHISGNSVCVFIDGVSYDELRNCSNSLIEEFEYCYLFSNTEDDNYIYVVSSKENNVREQVQNLNKAFNGKGGGRDTYAQGKIIGAKEEIIKYFN